MSAVLIVDDSLTVRMDLSEALEAAAFRVVTVPTLEAARHALQHDDFAMVLLDVILPDGDGIELLREIRANPRTAALKVLLLSTEAEVRDRVRGLTTGADDYVGKPYDRPGLVSRALALIGAAADPKRRPVLIIDDSPTYRGALRQALEAEGFAVIEAESGEEGLKVAPLAQPAAVIVDGVLPGIDGVTTIRRIRLDPSLRQVPCLLLTASHEPGAELRALDAGADAFVRKDDDVGFAVLRLQTMLRQADPSGRRGPRPAPTRVLAVDDSPTFLDAIAHLLREEGYEVLLARSGEEALELLAVQAVDCILLDRIMPGLGGTETCRLIKGSSALRDVPLLMLTALEDRDAMLAGLGAGADDYIAKSADETVLKARVKAQVRRKQFEDENRAFRDQLLAHELEARDARAARELAAARAVLLEDLARKNRELEAFSYSVSHDLRAPLRSIDGFTRALAEGYAEVLDPTGQGYLRRVRASTARMGELIDDLLALSRIGQAELKRAPVDLSALAAEVIAELQRAEPDRHVEVTLPPGLKAEGDGRLIKIVLENLLGNAWKFTRRTEVATIELGFLPGEPGAFIIRDNGAGFDMSYASKLFAPFQRLHTADEYPGTGIGLATIARIIDRHGGRVWAEGEPGRGATFSFTLPQPVEPARRTP